MPEALAPRNARLPPGPLRPTDFRSPVRGAEGNRHRAQAAPGAIAPEGPDSDWVEVIPFAETCWRDRLRLNLFVLFFLPLRFEFLVVPRPGYDVARTEVRVPEGPVPYHGASRIAGGGSQRAEGLRTAASVDGDAGRGPRGPRDGIAPHPSLICKEQFHFIEGNLSSTEPWPADGCTKVSEMLPYHDLLEFALLSLAHAKEIRTRTQYTWRVKEPLRTPQFSICFP